ncbi:MAG: hypothetical protein WA902_24325 [Thermosynechococcaceae cyanobacterium]
MSRQKHFSQLSSFNSQPSNEDTGAALAALPFPIPPKRIPRRTHLEGEAAQAYFEWLCG